MSFKETILQETFKIFQEYGVRQLTTDELIQKLNISRSTFREVAQDQSQLLALCVENALLNRKAEISQLISESETAVDALMHLMKLGLRQVGSLSPAFIVDLQSDYPEAWELIAEYIGDYQYKCLQQLVNKGKEEGVLQPEIDAHLVTRYFLSQFEILFNNTFFPMDQFQRDDVYKTIFYYYLRGITTEKGLTIIDQYSEGHLTETD